MTSGPDPASAHQRLRALGRPQPVEVRTDDHGEPCFVRLRGRPARRVEAIRERWRIDDEWWREAISREYRAVVLDDGAALTLYEDLLTGSWYVQKA
ncbi:MAG: hypothetical protein OEZ65_06840 [Gemmatimonadota bacterium]|nr:hypothetical protein [Gemmatimonadota bacterium]MDH5759289.1 hypothetical protein [Gemmatimonadota bacterium]